MEIASLREIVQGSGDAKERLSAIAALLRVASENRKSARTDTSRYYVRNSSKSKRQQLNDNAVNILSRIRAGTLEAKDLSEEQKVALAHYSGCGGGLIGSDGKKGSAYEYYTPKAVAEGVWDAVKTIGFNGGKVLDPCSGVGIFGATSPLNCTIDACELNPDSGKINSLLNDGPGYRTHIGPFEEFASAVPDESYDAVVSNVPFGDVADRGGNRFKDPEFQDSSLEVYFILKALKKLRPGGIAALIAPVRCVGTGGDGGAKLRDMRVQTSLMAEFIGAYRLPSGTFSDAQTDTVTDVIFYRKYDKPTLEKIKELQAQNPAVLAEANVMWSTYINGKYFTTSEGKRYIFGTEGTKKGQFGDVYAVIAETEGGVVQPTDVKKMMLAKRLPASRINWDLLNQAETQPIVYNEGDVMVQGGATLVMQGGEWVVQKAAHDEAMAAALASIATPYRAFENKITIDRAREINAYYSERCANLDLPVWFRGTMAVLGEKSATDAKKFWKQGVVALSCDEVREDRKEEKAFNYLEGYKALSGAMKTAKATEADGRKCGGTIGDAIRRLSKLYSRTNGYSAFWRGEIEAEVKRTAEQDAFLSTEDGKLANLHYTAKSAWLKVEDVKAIKGKSFDPYTDNEWAMNAEGEICEAADYYSGGYSEFLTRLDAEIKAAKTPEIKAKLIHQKLVAEVRVIKPNTASLTYDLRSPYVTLEEKLEFLKSYGYMPYAVIGDTKNGRCIIAEPRGDSRSREVKIRRCFEHYLSNYTIRVGTQRFANTDDSPEEKRRKNDEAIEEVRKLIETANVQFNDWVRANAIIQERIRAQAEKPENCFFAYEEDSRPISIPGIRTDDGKGNPIHLHDYQAAFVRKMGRGFEGINAFGVGLGKTFTALASVQYVQSIGAKKKTLFVVPKAVFSNWQKEANWVYTNPDECLFVGMRKNKSGKDAFVSSAVLEDFDAIRDGRYSKIFMTMPVFEKLRMKQETVEGYLQYLESSDAALAASMKKADDEAAEGRREKIGNALTARADQSAPFIEDLGIDSLVIDEAHFFKNAAEAQSFGRDIVSLSLSQASRRGADALAKAWYFRKLSPKKDGVLLLTATPITNSPLEMFSMLSLAVGTDRINKLCGGTSGPDQFLEVVCKSEHSSVVRLDASKQDAEVFTGLKNVEMLRGMLHSVATFKDADALGAAKVEREILPQKITLSVETRQSINRYRIAYAYAKKDETGRAAMQLEVPDCAQIFEAVKDEFRESESVLASPFNLLLKMQNEIFDPELNERASIYTFDDQDEQKVAELIEAWNKLNKTETSNKVSRYVDESDIKKSPKNSEAENQAAWLGQDEDDAVENDKWTYIVRAAMLDDGTLRLNAQTYQAQDAFEKLADKMGVNLGVKPSAKQSALLENIKKEIANPRGLISRDPRVSSPIVKQIVFCDNKPSHCKLRKMITKNCGIPAAKIAIITGEVNSSVDEILDVQNGFNGQGEDNKYQLIIANKKAEVGINLQKGTQAIHHLTIGWTPDSVEQRNGRGARQGNATESVAIYFYDAENTFDEVKRNMVNKKSNWIGSVVSKDGGNKVDVARKFTNADYEALAGLASDDPDAVQKFVEAKEKAEAEARMQEVKNTQRICLETIEANRKWLKENRKPDPMLEGFMKKAYSIHRERRRTDSVVAELIEKEANPRRINAAQKKADEARALYEEQIKLIRATFDFTGARTAPEDLIKSSAFAYGQLWGVKSEGVRVKQDNPIFEVWQRKRKIAEGLIESSVKTFADMAKEPGGEVAGVARAMADGTLAKNGNGHKMWTGCFVRYKGGLLGVVTDDSCILQVVEAYRVMWQLRGTENFDGVVYYPETPEYEDVLKEAGEIERRMRSAGAPADEGFASIVPRVEEYVGEVVNLVYPETSVVLPAPLFPYPIFGTWAIGSARLTKIVEEQSEYIDRYNVVRREITLKKMDGVTIVGETDSRRTYVCEVVFPALLKYAEANGFKLTLNDFPKDTTKDNNLQSAGLYAGGYFANQYLTDRDELRGILERANIPQDSEDLLWECRKVVSQYVKAKATSFDWKLFDEVDTRNTFIENSLSIDVIDRFVMEIRGKIEAEQKAAHREAAESSASKIDSLALDAKIVVTDIEPDSMKTKMWHKVLVFHKNYGAKYSPRGCKKHPEYGTPVWIFTKSEWLRLIAEHPEVKADIFARPAE